MRPAWPRLGSKSGAICGGTVLGLLVTCVTVWLTVDLRDRTIAAHKRELVHFGILAREAAERTLQAIDLAQRDILEDMAQKSVQTPADLESYADPESLHDFLEKRILGLSQADAISVVDANGRLLNFSRAWPIPPMNIADRPYFIRAKSDPTQDGMLAVVRANRSQGRSSFYLVRRIVDRDGMFLGLVLGSIRLSYFEDLYRSILAAGDNTIVLALSDGTMVLRYPPAPDSIGHIITNLARPGVGTIEDVREITSEIDFKTRYTSLHALTHYPAKISISIDAESVLQPWRREAAWLGGAALLLDLAVAGGVALMLRQLAVQKLAGDALRQEAAAESRRERDRAALQSQAAAERATILSGLATVFEQQVGQMSRAVAHMAGDVQGGAVTVAGLAKDTANRTRDAAAEAAGGAVVVTAIAVAIETLTGSIEQVARQSVRGAALIKASAVAAEEADATVATLTASAGTIGQIVDVISSIAQQTNLLALNATIEAARAGDAGRGFAVVAAEVKTLSKAVSQATEDIKRQIDGMQAASNQTAAAMQEIQAFVATVNAIAADITGAMELQRVATVELARSMVGAADGARTLSGHVDAARAAATQTGARAAAVEAVAQTLAGQADALRAASGQFLTQVNAA